MDVITTTESLTAVDGHEIFYRTWSPEGSAKAVVHIHHGMAEHSLRYHRFAHALCLAGYWVVAHDHRGHGKSVVQAKDLGHIGDQGGWQAILEDSLQLRAHLAAHQTPKPWILFGHSMGSFICLNQIQLNTNINSPQPSGLVLCGSALTPYIKRWALNRLAKTERTRLGKHGHSALIKKMTFEDFNRQCKPVRTQADWLSRVPAEVDRYLGDKLCGFECSTETWCELSDALLRMFRPKALNTIPNQLPTLVLYGDKDPMGGRNSNLQLFKRLRASGLKNIKHIGYQGARHEILNEIEANLTIKDCVNWLNQSIISE